jgi:hypothetical protein
VIRRGRGRVAPATVSREAAGFMAEV